MRPGCRLRIKQRVVADYFDLFLLVVRLVGRLILRAVHPSLHFVEPLLHAFELLAQLVAVHARAHAGSLRWEVWHAEVADATHCSAHATAAVEHPLDGRPQIVGQLLECLGVVAGDVPLVVAALDGDVGRLIVLLLDADRHAVRQTGERLAADDHAGAEVTEIELHRPAWPRHSWTPTERVARHHRPGLTETETDTTAAAFAGLHLGIGRAILGLQVDGFMLVVTQDIERDLTFLGAFAHHEVDQVLHLVQIFAVALQQNVVLLEAGFRGRALRNDVGDHKTLVLGQVELSAKRIVGRDRAA